MGVFSVDSFILFLVWCKLEQNNGKRKGRGGRLAVFDVYIFALLYTIVNYAKMVYEMPNWQCVPACRSFKQFWYLVRRVFVDSLQINAINDCNCVLSKHCVM